MVQTFRSVSADVHKVTCTLLRLKNMLANHKAVYDRFQAARATPLAGNALKTVENSAQSITEEFPERRRLLQKTVEIQNRVQDFDGVEYKIRNTNDNVSLPNLIQRLPTIILNAQAQETANAPKSEWWEDKKYLLQSLLNTIVLTSYEVGYIVLQRNGARVNWPVFASSNYRNKLQHQERQQSRKETMGNT